MAYTDLKLEYLLETKELIREAIKTKGQSISDADTFRSYADKIAAIHEMKTATGIDASALESEGVITATFADGTRTTASVVDNIITETYADGSTLIYTMEFDANGNPTKITDSNGNVTVLTW